MILFSALLLLHYNSFWSTWLYKTLMAPLHRGSKHLGSLWGCRRRYLKRYFSFVKRGSAEMSKIFSCQHAEDTLWKQHHHTGIRLLHWKKNLLSHSRELFPWHMTLSKFCRPKLCLTLWKTFQMCLKPRKKPNQTQLKMAFSLSNNRMLAETSVGQKCSLQQ